MNKNIMLIISFLIIFIFSMCAILIYLNVISYYEEQCINNNGTGIYNRYGLFEKCVRSE